jgi:hypothetical protein
MITTVLWWWEQEHQNHLESWRMAWMWRKAQKDCSSICLNQTTKGWKITSLASVNTLIYYGSASALDSPHFKATHATPACPSNTVNRAAHSSWALMISSTFATTLWFLHWFCDITKLSTLQESVFATAYSYSVLPLASSTLLGAMWVSCCSVS